VLCLDEKKPFPAAIKDTDRFVTVVSKNKAPGKPKNKKKMNGNPLLPTIPLIYAIYPKM
jgi:hypothetical protein